MINNKTFHSLLFNLLLYIIFIFPLVILLRSATINVVTLILPILFLLYFYATKIKISFITDNNLLIYLFFFLLFILINSIFHNESNIIILKSLGNFRYLLLTIIVFFVLENTNKKQRVFLVNFNVLLIFFICADIIYQYFFYKNIFGFEPGMCPKGIEAGCKRFSGVFGDELIAGGYLSQIGVLFFLLFYYLNQKKKYIFYKSIIYFISLTSVIIVTGERNATLILILTFLFILCFYNKFKHIFLIISLFIGLIYFLGIFSKSIEERFIFPLQSLYKLNAANYYQKLSNNPWGYHYTASTELFLKKPIFGHGPKSFRIVCKNTEIEKKLSDNKEIPYSACATNPHNYLLEFLVENGIVGGVFYIGLIFIIIFQILRLRKKNNPENLIVIVIGSLILAVLFPFKPSGSFFSTFNSVILFYIFGFYLYYLKKVK